MRMLKWLAVVMLSLVCAVGGIIVLATYDEMTSALPPIERLLQYEPPVATRVFAGDGTLVEEFYRERRYLVSIEKIPPVVRNAFLAAEDADFYSHSGVDFIGIARAFAANLSAGSVVQGGSTITQQVVKALLLTPERSYERKMKEILLALRLEQHLTKDQILELYLNQIYFGEGNHGVGAASRSYFGKSVGQLTPAQAALLAGLPAAPSRYSPKRNPEAAMKRQRYVLRRMVEEGFLSSGDYQNALREEIVIAPAEDHRQQVRNYYTEAVRLQLEEMFGEDAPYNQGYTVHTSMSPRLQALADAAVRNGIERIDSELGYRGPAGHVDGEQMQARLDADARDSSLATLDPERIYRAVVTAVVKGDLEVALGPHRATIDTAPVKWAGSVKNKTFRAGDIVEVRTRKPGESQPRIAQKKPREEEEAEEEAGTEKKDAPSPSGQLYLAQTPEIEAALVAIDVKDGGVAAMVGGYDFLSTQFNRAVQAHRQPGSAFKPFVYAAGLDHGYTPASILTDSPVEYMDNGKPWQPRNYTRDYRGPIRFRTALEQSRNVVSVKLVDAVGVDTVVDYLERFHFDADIGANLSLALGTSEMSLLDLTAGYTAFAGGGVKTEPLTIRKVEDKDGTVFFEAKARRREVLSPQTAALMTYIMEGVVQRGTATSIKPLGRPVAGKTGTTNDQRDAWFIGYTPDLVVGVWVGFDDQTRSMGKMGTGGRVAAPIWLEFMKAALEGQPVHDFPIPDGIRCVNIDGDTGERATEHTRNALLECFKEGTEPVERSAVWAGGRAPQEQRPPRTPYIAAPSEDSPGVTLDDPEADPRFRDLDDGEDPYRVPMEADEDGRYRIPDEPAPDPRYLRPGEPPADGRFRVPTVRNAPPDHVPYPSRPPVPDSQEAYAAPQDRYLRPPSDGRYAPPDERDPEAYDDDRYEAQQEEEPSPEALRMRPRIIDRYGQQLPEERDPRIIDRYGEQPSARQPRILSPPPASRPEPPAPRAPSVEERYMAPRHPSPEERERMMGAPMAEEDVPRTPRDEDRMSDDAAAARRAEPDSQPQAPRRAPMQVYRPQQPSFRSGPPGTLPEQRPPKPAAPPSARTEPRRPSMSGPPGTLPEQRPPKPTAPPDAMAEQGRRVPSGPPGTLPEQRPPKPTAPPPGVRPRAPMPAEEEEGYRDPREVPVRRPLPPGFMPYPNRPRPPQPPDEPIR